MTRRTLLLAAALVLLVPEAASAFFLSCNVSATDVRFGSYTTDRLRTTGAVTVSCRGTGTNNPYVIALGKGSSPVYSDRTLRMGRQSLSYNLYTDSAHTRVWGDGGGGTETVTRLMTFRHDLLGPISQTTTVFAQLPAQGLPRPGRYVDAIVVLVIF